MPLIEEISDSEEDSHSPPPHLNLLELPSVPSTFIDRDSESSTPISELDKWKVDAERTLREIRALLSRIKEKDDGDKGSRTDEDASVAYYAAQFDGSQDWVTGESFTAARDILNSTYTPPSTDLLHAILSSNIRPLFASHPHPHLNPKSGRKLAPQPSGAGVAGNSDYYYEEQTWKERPGVGNVLGWCVRNIETEQYESLWPLIVPPLMAFLDDYQLPYRLEGTRIAAAFLHNVPPDLLRRTGVGELIYNAMCKSTQFLGDPITAALLSATIPALLRVIAATTKPSSAFSSKSTSASSEADRFDKLCTLLGEHIIGHIWVYGSDDADTMQATTDALPAVLTELGIGSVRYLKALIPQLLHTLSTDLPRPPSLILSTLRALQATITTCAPRIPGRRETILSGLAKAWVELVCEPPPHVPKMTEEERERVKEELVRTCALLKDVCQREGKGVQNEYRRLHGLDATTFEPLLGTGWMNGVVVG